MEEKVDHGLTSGLVVDLLHIVHQVLEVAWQTLHTLISVPVQLFLVIIQERLCPLCLWLYFLFSSVAVSSLKSTDLHTCKKLRDVWESRGQGVVNGEGRLH